MKQVIVYDPQAWTPPSELRWPVMAAAMDTPSEDLAQFIGDTDVFVIGSDRLVGRLALANSLCTPGQRVRFAPVSVGEFNDLPAASHLMKIAKQLEAGRVEELHMPTLRLVSSSQPRAILAFQVGFGFVARMAESWIRHGRKVGTVRFAMDEARSDHDLIEFHVAHNEKQNAAYLQFCALPSGWLKMGSGSTPTFRHAENPSELLKTVPSRRLQAAARKVLGNQASFDVVHITAHNGYVVDGEVMAHKPSEVIQVSIGPRVSILKG